MPHARAVADTGGVIGVWPEAADFPNLDAMALGIKRMADVVGVAHVGLGTDMLGFIRPPVFTSNAQLPARVRDDGGLIVARRAPAMTPCGPDHRTSPCVPCGPAC
ncbi:hypothetical protein [Ralstonia sp. Ralssp110]|uniref:hypothetical protein n=1 Tax=Ralstonia sp. Ralssp110 TaxID=3243004 RepID=UPI0039B5C9D9